jgi:hypothetical protein
LIAANAVAASANKRTMTAAVSGTRFGSTIVGAAGDDPSALATDVVADLRDLAEVINQFGPSGGEQGFTGELGGQDLVFGGHGPSLSVHHARASHLREFYRLALIAKRAA